MPSLLQPLPHDLAHDLGLPARGSRRGMRRVISGGGLVKPRRSPASRSWVGHIARINRDIAQAIRKAGL